MESRRADREPETRQNLLYKILQDTRPFPSFPESRIACLLCTELPYNTHPNVLRLHILSSRRCCRRAKLRQMILLCTEKNIGLVFEAMVVEIHAH